MKQVILPLTIDSIYIKDDFNSHVNINKSVIPSSITKDLAIKLSNHVGKTINLKCKGYISLSSGYSCYKIYISEILDIYD